MKKYVILLSFVSLPLWFSSCEDVSTALSEDQVIAGLKEALNVATDTAVAITHVTDGFYGNDVIKILFPEEASIVEDVVSVIPGGQALIDELVLKLNRAAEDAAIKAQPIFISAITGITFTDAFDILNGSDSAATHYLRVNTYTSLYDAFKPDIQNSLESVGAQQAWEAVINLYNSIPFVTPVNTDLADYTTNKALDGLFLMIAQEEEEIRTNPADQVTELLKNVFG